MHRVALIGDYSEEVLAHRAIPVALARAREELESEVTWDWILTRELLDAPRNLQAYSGIWVVPASPYQNTAGVLAAIRWARENRIPFLGTCGGFQHALIEFARNVAGLTDADHAETNPGGPTCLVSLLTCSLVEQSDTLRFLPGSRFAQIYGCTAAREGYHCRYGPNPAYRSALEHAGLRFTAFDAAGEIRGAELPVELHPFFLGTLFQPERAALAGATPPLARALLAAAAGKS